MPFSSQQNSEESIDEIVETILSTHQPSRTYKLPKDKIIEDYSLDRATFPDQIKRHKSGLDIVVGTIFTSAPEIYKTITTDEKDILTAGVYHAILSYGNRTRKLGNHYFFNHPLKAAQWRATAAEKLGSVLNLIPEIIEILQHDRIEERAESAVGEIKPALREAARKSVEETGHLITIYEQAGKEVGRISIPPFLSELPFYKGKFDALIANERPAHRLKGVLGRPSLSLPEFHDYFEALEKYIPLLKRFIHAVEEGFIDKELGIFRQEMEDLLQVAPLSKEEKEQFTSRVYETDKKLTRVGSELYYVASGKLFIAEDTKAIAAKFTDRLANTYNMNLRGRIARTKLQGGHKFQYFIFRPEDQRAGLVPSLEDEKTGQLKSKAGLILREQGLDLVSVLNIPPELTKTKWVHDLDNIVYGITHDNSIPHRAERIKEQQAKTKTKLPPHLRLYQLAKNIIVINHARLYFSDSSKNFNPLIDYLADELLDISERESRSMIEGTFSCHCLRSGNSLTIKEARRVYQGVEQYDQLGGFDFITESIEMPDGEFSFDGIFERYFDQRIKGVKSAIDPLYHEKRELFATTLAMNHLIRKYQHDKTFFLKGLTFTGIEPRPAVGVTR